MSSLTKRAAFSSGFVFLSVLIGATILILTDLPPSSELSSSGSSESNSPDTTRPQSSESNSSESSSGTVLQDCRTLQANYEKTNYIDFLKSQLSRFQAGSGTVFQTSEFSYFFDFADSGEISIEDVSRELYYLCLSEGFETNVWTDAAEPAPQQPSAPSVEYVEMPNLIGAAVGDVKNWLSRNGYKFTLDIREQSTNPSQACVISGRAPVTSQQPAAGSVVENSSSVRVTIYRNCPTATNPFPLPDSHTG